MFFFCLHLKYQGTLLSYHWFQNVLNYISGTQTPKEDAVMNSIPATIREEKALLRTSGGCQSTGRQLHLGQSTIAGPSTLTNLLRCWTLALYRLRSLPRTPALHRSGLWSRMLWQSRTGTTGKRKKGCQCSLRDSSGCFVNGQSHMLLMVWTSQS